MPPVNDTIDAAVDYIVKARLNALQRLALAGRKLGSTPDANTATAWYEQLDDLLLWLETKARMTPDLKQRSKIDVALQTIEKPEFHFAASTVARAKALYENFERERWGAPKDMIVDGADDARSTDPADAPVRRPRQRSEGGPVQHGKTMKYPPADHSIWGLNGCMHGCALRVTHYQNGAPPRRNAVYDDRYEREQRKANVHGHNHNEVGTWYPRQIITCFRGAHGASQAGIYGDANDGAYSIISSGAYHEVDKDEGEFLYYSAPNSFDNEDPHAPAQTSPELERSLQNRKPVRVLRSAGKSQYSPACGFRYDGLYQVTMVRYPTNRRGGMYQQFGLARLDEEVQIPLTRARPNGRDIRDYEKINDYFPGVW
ncbi:hypothetical protein LTR53_013739 [Teratosphaeriaceae sp. CCFEE 6253]|nr:hypothetical protein LTR53_013739 [Teratosphaeriaceae sp. CCFEE 6253]